MRHIGATVLLAGVISLAFLALGCEEPRGSVRGTVYLLDNTPGASLLVRAVRPEYPGVLVRTDGGGSYQFGDIPAGR